MYYMFPASVFLRRLFDVTAAVLKCHRHVRLISQAKLDLNVWPDFLCQYGDRSCFRDDNFLTGDFLQLYSDAAESIGFGALFGTEWCYGQWLVAWHSYNRCGSLGKQMDKQKCMFLCRQRSDRSCFQQPNCP